MRKNFGAKPFLYPQPVMILGTYDEKGNSRSNPGRLQISA